ncbi:hypothetical protein [Paenibacillus sp. L3-i20]|uniref:hypothetical protein n=1 Tax=Paenibacillus sp. L3-i20 TaxID=2905833 RepID=UPI00207E68AC|nr:hypothetical protein [Paenibacillus sp. L3-i20]GKU79003.1 hypothetical protein L3i20_v234000 [Paenibacillus sp. L3-i20]
MSKTPPLPSAAYNSNLGFLEGFFVLSVKQNHLVGILNPTHVIDQLRLSKLHIALTNTDPCLMCLNGI